MSARPTPSDLAWPQARAAEALLALARAARLRPHDEALAQRASDEDAATLAERLVAAAEASALELEPIETPYADVDALLERAGPALFVLDDDAGGPRVLALLRGGRRARLLAPDGTLAPCDLARLRETLCAPHERRVAPAIEPVLDATGLQGRARERARRALVGEQLGATPVGAVFVLRAPPGRRFVEAATRAGLPRLALGVAAASLLASATWLLSWVPFGRGILAGRFEPAWFAAWALLLFATLPLRAAEAWLQSLFGVRFGVLLRRRLMAGATRLDPAVVRGEGAGALLGRVLDSEALEGLLLGGGFVLVAATIDVALAGWVLAQGPAPVLMPVLFVAFLLTACALGLLDARRAREQADARLALTHDLVERMQGQRTRVVQEPRAHWHLVEDALLDGYLRRARALDGTSLALLTLVTGGWLVAGTAALGAAFASGGASTLSLALGLGALLLGQQALGRLTSGLLQLAACAVAWRQVRPVYRAATRAEELGLPRAALRPAPDDATRATDDAARPPLLAGRGVSYRHEGRAQPALAEADLAIARGERVLVEGPSGGGKSTLVSLLTGWRAPLGGSLLLDGLDRSSQGSARWRRRVAAAPQFHENHVFTGTLGFNLRLASPDAEPSDGAAQRAADERALALCRELGLGELVERMPAGLRQIVGETGWQLSHGERSRLFVARALLADADLVVLDESLSALDPETAGQVLACVRRRARALLVVAHP